MKKSKYPIFVVIFILLFFYGCIIIVPNFAGFNSGYKRLNDNDKSLIRTTNKAISELENKDTIIYLITGKQLYNFIQTNKNVLVYIWRPNCSSSKCYSIKLLHDYCKKRNIKLIIIVEYFSIEIIKKQYSTEFEMPIFSVNTNYYKTNYCDKYIRLFLKDMLYGINYDDNTLYENLFSFSNGKLLTTQMNF